MTISGTGLTGPADMPPPSEVLEGVKHYIDSDVLTEAKRRIHHIYDTFDNVFVSFSGGKDSLATLELAEEVRLERGDSQKVKVIFRDEELSGGSPPP